VIQQLLFTTLTVARQMLKIFADNTMWKILCKVSFAVSWSQLLANVELEFHCLEDHFGPKLWVRIVETHSSLSVPSLFVPSFELVRVCWPICRAWSVQSVLESFWWLDRHCAGLRNDVRQVLHKEKFFFASVLCTVAQWHEFLPDEMSEIQQMFLFNELDFACHECNHMNCWQTEPHMHRVTDKPACACTCVCAHLL